MAVEERPVLVAPGPFPDLRASQVAGAIGRGLERAGLMPPDLCPLADGGAGTIDALLPRLGGEARDGYALVDDGGTAIVEAPEHVAAAAAAGAQVIVLAAAGEVAEPSGTRVVRADPGFVLDELEFDARMRAARAIVTGTGRLDQGALSGLVFEVGTRARQAGVPLHAIVGADALDSFAKRIIDLQLVLEASTPAELAAAGEELGRALASGAA
jgi:glycerate kinase